VVGLPIGSVAPLTLCMVVAKPSRQAARSGSTLTVTRRSSAIKARPACVDQLSRSSNRNAPAEVSSASNPSCRMVPLLGSCT
jgi:hypothetical protein